MSSDEKQMSAHTHPLPSTTLILQALQQDWGCVYSGQDELLATARSAASTPTFDPYSKGQGSSQSFVHITTAIFTIHS